MKQYRKWGRWSQKSKEKQSDSLFVFPRCPDGKEEENVNKITNGDLTIVERVRRSGGRKKERKI